jgi:hypothetical protein
MIILCEGAKNTGKTYLIENSEFRSYKFPFISYYKGMMAEIETDTGKNSAETFHFTASFDVTLLSMAQQGNLLCNNTILIDRSFMSNIVLGELQGRISHEYGKKYIDWLFENGHLDDQTKMIYVDKNLPDSGRTTHKDDWEFLGYEEQKETFEKYFDYLKIKHNWEPTRFINNMDEKSMENFDNLIKELNGSRISFDNTDVTCIESNGGRWEYWRDPSNTKEVREELNWFDDDSDEPDQSFWLMPGDIEDLGTLMDNIRKL